MTTVPLMNTGRSRGRCTGEGVRVPAPGKGELLRDPLPVVPPGLVAFISVCAGQKLGRSARFDAQRNTKLKIFLDAI
jgi:hypothetical protein